MTASQAGADGAAAALSAAIAALQAQRGVLGDAVVDVAVAPLQAQLAALAPAPVPGVDELRLVSLLVLDVVGSTALTYRLDPEDISAVMDGALADFAAIVRQHGGQVLEFAGDNLLGAFGLDATREDDAERAVRCGLALVAHSRALATEVLARHGQPGFGVRVGVHTGPVLRGTDSTGPLRGNTQGLARRMEQTAAPGSVQISHDTWRHVQGRFEVEPRPPCDVPGRDAPQPCYRVLAPADRTTAGWAVEGLATPLLGREAELAQLLAALAEVRADGRARGVTVVAEAGLGKTRLVHELQQHIEAQGALPTLRARCLPGGRLQPYKLLHDVLAGWCGVADSDSAAVARQRLQAVLAPLLAADEVDELAWLFRLVGLAEEGGERPDPRTLRDRGLAVFQAVLAARARLAGAPLLLLADDLHWADEASLDLIETLLASPLPLLLVASARPELLDRRTTWAAAAEARHRPLVLQPLPAADSQALAAALLQRLQTPAPALATLLVQRAGGNPYFMEELLKMLVDDGVITILPAQAGAGTVWQVDLGRLGQARLPSTLSGVLQARLDALAAPQRQALQLASIVGGVFWDQALATLGAEAPAQLPALRARSLVVARPGSVFEGCSEDAFHHQLLHQAAYDTVPRARRRAGHAQVARWLAARVSDRMSEHLATTAHHFLGADESQTAAEWLARAAEDAWARFDNRSAYAQVRQALSLLDPQQPDQQALCFRLLLLGLRIADLLGERAQQAEWVQATEALASSTQAEASWPVRAAYARAVMELRRDRHAASQAAALNTLALARAIGDHERAAEVCNVLVVTSRLLGQPAEARAHAMTGIGLAREAGLRPIQLRLQANLGLVDFEAGDFITARLALREALELAQNEPSGAAILGLMRCNLACCEQELGNYTGARRWAEEAVAWGRQVGDATADCVGSQNLAEALLALGDPEAALPHARHAVQSCQAIGNRLFAAKAGLVVAEIELERRQIEAALEAALAARDLFEQLQQPAAQTEAALWLAAIRQAQGAGAAVLAGLDEHLAALDTQLEEGAATARLAWLAHRVLAGARDARAAHWLQRARQTLQRQAERIPDAAERRHFMARHTVARALRDYTG
jgi:predicted ATPase/class 3 adenylate cyclase